MHQLRLKNVPELWLVFLPSSEILSERRVRSRDGDLLSGVKRGALVLTQSEGRQQQESCCEMRAVSMRTTLGTDHICLSHFSH